MRSAALAWASENLEKSYGWPNVFYSLQEAVTAKGLFFSDANKIQVIGLGLASEFVDTFAAHVTKPGVASAAECGLIQVVKHRQLVPQGEFLGFELLPIHCGQVECSWLCNHLEAHFSTTLGTQLNEWGLLDDLEIARRCCDVINRGEVGAEPGLWLPWGLVRFG